MKAGAVRKLSGAELRAMRDQRAAADPAAEAWAHESSFLRCLATAQEDFDWIVANEAWTVLGHDTFADWWDARAPRMREMGFQPAKQIALAVLARIRSDEEKLPRAQRRTSKQLAVSIGLSESSVRRIATRSLPAPADAEADLEETSAAGPAANPEGDSPVLGEPVGVDEQASTGTQSPPAADASTTLPHAGVPAVGDQFEERTEAEHEQDSAWHGGPGECGVGCSCGASFDGFNSVDEATDELALHIANPEERDVEEAAEASADLPAAATTSLPDGDGNPMPEQSQQPGQDSPPVLGSEGFPGRAETDHHRAGVSGGGHAPALPGVVELETLEGGDLPAVTSPSSSDLDVAGNPAERLLLAVAGLVHYLNQVDVDAVGPLLLGPDVEQLFDHAEEISAHITRIGKARFAEMLHTQ